MKVQKVIVLTIFLSLALMTGFAQSAAHLDSAWVRPPLEPKTVALQLAGGTVGGMAGYIGVMLPMAIAGGRGGPIKAGGSLIGQLLGLGLGIPFGATSGVSVVGRTDSTSGSVLAAGIGSLVGIFLLAPYPEEIINSIWILPLASAAGATLMFNLTRHYRRPSNANGKKPTPVLNSTSKQQPRGTP
ncbi:MAG: hypothetical protein IID13_05330 [Candidatus Marinimicrobia bacterium]|nr:hypothetical protein [Candidatus Neomarinimicrobiota bacterium]